MDSATDDAHPRLVVFDLDYTLWQACWCDTHVSPPIKAGPKNQSIVDSYGERLSFYPDVPEILAHIEAKDGVESVSASRTSAPRIAEKMLKLLHVDGRPSDSYFVHKVWGVGSKVHHFKKIRDHTGVDYKDMVFFDDESRNRDVEERLGVTFVLVTEGVTWDLYHQGIDLWRSKQLRELGP